MKVLDLFEATTAKALALKMQTAFVEHNYDTEIRLLTVRRNVIGANNLTTTAGFMVLGRVNPEGDWEFGYHIGMNPKDGVAVFDISNHDIHSQLVPGLPKLQFRSTFTDIKTTLDLDQNIQLEGLDPFDKPWTSPAARQAALKFQTELLDINDALDIELVPTSISLLSDAISNNGMSATFASFMLLLTKSEAEQPRLTQLALLLHYFVRGKTFHLYHVDTDFSSATASRMYDHLKTHAAKLLAEAEEASQPGAMTILTRFAKELVSHGFEAEVKSSSEPGIINSSKLCIEVKGYGMKDSLKLYKPLWNHEKGMVAFVDVKTERRFSTVAEMVAVLKERYPKLPQCLSYFPPAVKKTAKKKAK